MSLTARIVRVAGLVAAAGLALGTAAAPVRATGQVQASVPASVPVQTVRLPTDDVTTSVLDEAHGHLLLGSRRGPDGVLVTDLHGIRVATLLPHTLVDDLALSKDKHEVYAGSSSPNTIYVIDLASLSVSATFPLPAGDCPDSVTAISSTYVAFGHSCNGPSGGVGVLNLTDGTVNTMAVDQQIYRPNVKAIPGTTEFLAGERDVSAARVLIFDAQSGSPVLLREAIADTSGLPGVNEEVAVSPDGATFVAPCLAGACEWQISDLTHVATYSGHFEVDAVAFSPDGATVALGGASGGNNVALFRHSDHTLKYAYNSSDAIRVHPTTVPEGLIFTANKSSLEQITRKYPATPPVMQLTTLPVNSLPAKAGSVVRLAGKSSVSVKGQVLVSGVLTFGDGFSPRWRSRQGEHKRRSFRQREVANRVQQGRVLVLRLLASTSAG